MSTQVQYRRGTATENNAFTGALAEITVDTTNWTLRVHDGVTAGGGGNVATVAYVTAQIAALSANSITDGTSNVKVYNSGNVATTVAGTANVLVVTSTGANIAGYITTSGDITGASLTVSTGNITGGNIVNAGANGVGNIGSSGGYFNTVFAKATSAQYADLAEMYQGDESYMPGTVVEFGGANEVTITTTDHSVKIAGVVSTNPSYLMNSGLNTLGAIPIALTGRVPCQVIGPVRKGDRLVSSMIPGVAQALDTSCYQPGCIIGKSLEDWAESTVKSIEVVVGRV